MGDQLTDGIETQNVALARRLGALAKRRREEVGLSQNHLAAEVGLKSHEIRDFEYYGVLPPADIRRKIEGSLGWRLEVIDDVARMTDRAADTLTMEELDAEDSYHLEAHSAPPSLTSASNAELLAEVARRGL